MQLKAVFGDEPYAIALVELDEGVRMMTNIVGVDPDAVHVGLAVGSRGNRCRTGGTCRCSRRPPPGSRRRRAGS